MPPNRCFRLTDEDIEELRDRTRDAELIVAYSRWVKRAPELDELIRQITSAFADVELAGGVGLLEATGLDDYASTVERAELRSRDEKTDWRRIEAETLNRCYAAPSFFDACGFVFHLPAFLIAELNDQHPYGFIDYLIDSDGSPDGWLNLLTMAQREAIVATLKLVADHPNYTHRLTDIDLAVQRFKNVSQQTT